MIPLMPVPPGERGHYLRWVVTVASVIVAWGMMHNQYLIRIEPRHFTVFHPRWLPLTDLTLLGMQYAFLATVGPAGLYGILSYFAARHGRLPKLSLRHVLLHVMVMIAAIEAMCLLMWWATATWYDAHQQPLILPAAWFPEVSRGIVITQTINLYAYAASFALGPANLVLIYRRRAMAKTASGRPVGDDAGIADQ